MEHISHPVFLIDTRHHMCQLSERISPDDQLVSQLGLVE